MRWAASPDWFHTKDAKGTKAVVGELGVYPPSVLRAKPSGIAEELFHIGVVVGVLRRFNIPWPRIYPFNALLFIILHQSHGGGFIGFVPMLGFAAARCFLDFLFYKSGHIAVPIVAHMLNNLRVLSFNWFQLLP
jgi:membrane protease YdiL (CAAX protease family)